MKRRSPWLAFAACALLRGGLVAAEPGELPAVQEKRALAEKPALSISEASTAAENELKRRGLAEDHMISSVRLTSAAGQTAYYTAQIQPPVSMDGKSISVLPSDSKENERASCLAFKIEMNGTVTATEEPLFRRIRVIQGTPAPK